MLIKKSKGRRDVYEVQCLGEGPAGAHRDADVRSLRGTHVSLPLRAVVDARIVAAHSPPPAASPTTFLNRGPITNVWLRRRAHDRAKVQRPPRHGLFATTARASTARPRCRAAPATKTKIRR
ncbi:hypothetical protein ACJJTC_003729 [Scirpophaga incertulas]